MQQDSICNRESQNTTYCNGKLVLWKSIVSLFYSYYLLISVLMLNTENRMSFTSTGFASSSKYVSSMALNNIFNSNLTNSVTFRFLV